ncbi:MAG TPA: M48 family metallopeptidase [Bryobacteraceae bacterium]|nr:M48 family metallopeptidase [Bryobacteraceae bacterium]
MKPAHTIPIALFIWIAVTVYAVYRMPREERVGFSAPMEIWADAVRGAGTLTASPSVREQRVGDRLAASIPPAIPQDPTLQPYVEKVGARIAAHAGRKDVIYRFTVREHPTPNAFALPGGYVYVNTGLLAFVKCEDELSMVLGHEVSHIELRHTAPNLLKDALSLGYKKFQEFDADEAGVRLAVAAGYKAPAALSLFRRLAAQSPPPMEPHRPRSPMGEAAHVMMETLGGFWNSHPAAQERVRRISHTIGKS